MIVPGRVLLREGVLQRVDEKGKKSENRILYLFNDMLIYAEEATVGRNNVKEVIPAHLMLVREHLELKCNKKNNFSLSFFRCVSN